eukprot:TRINITY_DN4399_c1_g1_i2.p1 TRINITY_DN4399_c1_g1~~TRINITY_DN4399_c1_g1_i2.p1  ORF type:complete len:650 (+),score=165.71 TRINITY_DN4399_c1_g1_i2:110-2059(+)
MDKSANRKSQQILKTLEIDDDDGLSGSEGEEAGDTKSKDVFLQKTMWNQLRNLLKKKKDPSSKEPRPRRKSRIEKPLAKKEGSTGSILGPSTSNEASPLKPPTDISPRKEKEKEKEFKEDRLHSLFSHLSGSRRDVRRSMIVTPSRSASASNVELEIDKEKRIREAVAQFAGKKELKNVTKQRAISERASQIKKPKNNTDSKIHRMQQEQEQKEQAALKSNLFSTLQPSTKDDYIRNLIDSPDSASGPEIILEDDVRAHSVCNYDIGKDQLTILESELEMLRGLTNNDYNGSLDGLDVEGLDMEGMALEEEVYKEAKDVMDKASISGRSQSINLPEGAFFLFHGQFLEVINQIGKGGTATVYKAKMAEQFVAMKVISLSGVRDRKRMRQVLAAEVEMMKEFHHPNVIRYYGHFYQRKEQEMNVILELVEGGCLTKLIQRLKKFDEKLTAHVLHQVLCGLCFLHKNSIIHRDLKPDNVLVEYNTGFVKLIDFGAATKVLGMRSCRRSVVGTPWYTAPEVIKEEEYSYPADIWSLGCSAIEMLSGNPPYSHLNAIAALFTMADKPPSIPDDISPSSYEFISTCLILDRRKRPFALELLKSKLFEEEISNQMFVMALASGLADVPVNEYKQDYLQVIKDHNLPDTEIPNTTS